ncbi:FUSC family protein [Marinobacter bohaiensis]|uniref:FUSC family protein n=1 Tax=Marinobacter bohaiensis TaxID=2201898 RepID=UPI000DAEBE36|nr:FUSC family protein [Marinobacter bohaiensis]
MAAERMALPAASDWRQAWRSWRRSDGLSWLFVFKTLLAAFITLWLAMLLQLQQPSTALITVFIVMQPQSGQVMAKSLARAVGSLMGLGVMIVLVALFAQQRWLFLAAMSLWIGACIAGAARYRDMRFYACVLAGYTAALIGLPASAHPDTAIADAIWRVLEIFLALFVSSVVSILVFPQTSHAAMRSAVASRFGRFAGFVLAHLDGRDPDALSKVNADFATEAVGLEASRSASAIEDPHTRLRSRRLQHLNHAFLGLLTRFNALHRQLRRLREESLEPVIESLSPCLELVAGLLQPWPDSLMSPQEAGQFADALEQARAPLMQRIRQSRRALLAGGASESELLEFNTAAELLYRFAETLHAYARAHQALGSRNHAREQVRGGFASRVNLYASLVAGGRAAITIFLGGAIWFALDWRAGVLMIANAAAICALSSGMPHPTRLAIQMAIGTFIGGVFGVIESVYVFPLIDGLPLLLMALLPVYLLGLYLSLKPAYAFVGLGLLIMFTMGSVPTNPTQYAPVTVISNYLGLFMGGVLAAVTTSVILPPASAWMWWVLEKDLRGVLGLAATGGLDGLNGRFESRTRDILAQAYGLAARRPDVQAALVQWSLIVQEVGHAMINWRQELAAQPVADDLAVELAGLERRLVTLFATPSPGALNRAREQVERVIWDLHGRLEAQSHFQHSAERRVLSYLHFVRTTLLDRHSILRRQIGVQTGNAEGDLHAQS